MRVVGSVVLATTLLGVGLAGAIAAPMTDDPETRAALTAWCAKFQTELDANKSRIAAELDVRTEPGRAFDAYSEALETLRTCGPDLEQEARDALLAKHAEAAEPLDPRLRTAIATMRDGTHRADVGYALDLEQDLAAQVPNLLELRTLANVAGVEVRRLVANHEAEHAVDLALDALTLGVDVMRGPILIQQMIGCALVGIVTDQVLDDATLTRLDPAARIQLVRGLELIDRRMPIVCDGRAEALVLGHQTLAGRTSGAATLDVDTALALARFWDRVNAAPALDWAGRQRQLEHLETVQPNDDLASLAETVRSAEAMLRQAKARVRVLRLALAPVGEDLVLDDPLGEGPIERLVESAGFLRYRSGHPGSHLVERSALEPR